MRILSAEYVLPIASDPVRDGAVAIEADVIVAVGPVAGIVEKFPAVAVEDHARSAIIPGLVNCHSHLEITAMRGFLDDVEDDFAAWLLRLHNTRTNRMSEADIGVAAVAGALEGAAAGVTCFGDIGRSGKAGAEALRAVGLRGVVYQETNFSPDERNAAADLADLQNKVAKLRAIETAQIRIGVSPHSPYTVSGKLFSSIAEYAVADGLKVSIHAAESADEDRLLRTGEGFFTRIYEKFGVSWKSPKCSPIEFLERTGIMSTRPLLAHCVHAADSDLEIIRAYAAAVAHCPKSNAKFGHGWAPFEKMLDAGIAVGLGSDSVASNNTCDILEESRFALLGARNRRGRARFLTSKEMLVAATLGGARAMGLDDITGSLEVGKQADLAVISLAGLSQAPVNEIYAALVHSSGAADVTLTVAAGKDIYRDGKFTNLDAGDTLDALERIRGRINT